MADQKIADIARHIRQTLISVGVWRGDTLHLKLKGGELYFVVDELLALCDAADPHPPSNDPAPPPDVT